MSSIRTAMRDIDRTRRAFERSRRAGPGMSYGPGLRTPPGVKSGSFALGQIRGYDGRFLSGGTGFHIVGLDKVMHNLRRRGEAIKNIPVRALQPLSVEALDYMQINASWTDRTGEARRTLKSDVTVDKNDEATLWLMHGVYYGWYLETMQGGRFNILERTINEFVMPRLEAAILAADKGLE
jgi:hypothetical protein